MNRICIWLLAAASAVCLCMLPRTGTDAAKLLPAQVLVIGAGDGAITVEGGTHTARVSRVIRDLNATAVVLRAAEAPDAPPLCVVLPEGVRAAEGGTLSFSLLADRCRLWEE